MPVERRFMSTSQFCELMGIDQSRFICIENGVEGKGRLDWTKGVVIVLEDEMAQTTGTFPQLTTGKKKGGRKKSC